MYPIRPLAGERALEWHRSGPCFRVGQRPFWTPLMNAGFPLSQSNIWMLLGVLALTFVAKALVTLMTIRSGASGGVLQPGIALGFHAGCDARPAYGY